MNSIDRVLRIRHFFLLNLLLWMVAGILEWIRIQWFVASFQQSFDTAWLIRYPVSFFLTSWALSYLVFQSFLSLLHRSRPNQLLSHGLFAVAFGLILKILHPVVAMLLERLFLTSETQTWVQLWSTQWKIWYDVFPGIAIYVVLILLLHAVYSYRKWQDEVLHNSDLESNLLQATLHGMKMQMNPHFLFNAFNTISMMVRKGEKDRSLDMISNLGDMLRQSLQTKARAFTTLEQELNLLDKYLAIENERYRDRLTIETRYDPSINDVVVPNLILQPIVENAFKHGISKNTGPSILRITTERNGDFVHLKVFNNGSELPPGWDFNRDKGIGLLNTSTMLMRLYQEEVKFLINELDDGVLVEIVLPLRSHDTRVDS